MPGLAEHLPEDFEGREGLLAKFDSVGALATAYRSLQHQQMGSARWPGQTAAQGEIDAFFESIGAPKDENGYKVPDSHASHPLATKLREAARAARITQKQFESMLGLLDAATPADPSEAWSAETKERWGSSYEEKSAIAKRAVDRLSASIPGLKKTLDETKIGVHPDIQEALFRMGKQMGNDTTPAGGGAGGGNIQEARRLNAEWRKLQLSPATASRQHAEFDESVTRVWEIQARLKEMGFVPDDPRLLVERAGPPMLTPEAMPM